MKLKISTELIVATLFIAGLMLSTIILWATNQQFSGTYEQNTYKQATHTQQRTYIPPAPHHAAK